MSNFAKRFAQNQKNILRREQYLRGKKMDRQQMEEFWEQEADDETD